jgi:hypothetical protein
MRLRSSSRTSWMASTRTWTSGRQRQQRCSTPPPPWALARHCRPECHCCLLHHRTSRRRAPRCPCPRTRSTHHWVDAQSTADGQTKTVMNLTATVPQLLGGSSPPSQAGHRAPRTRLGPHSCFGVRWWGHRAEACTTAKATWPAAPSAGAWLVSPAGGWSSTRPPTPRCAKLGLCPQH